MDNERSCKEQNQLCQNAETDTEEKAVEFKHRLKEALLENERFREKISTQVSKFCITNKFNSSIYHLFLLKSLCLTYRKY